MRQSFGYRPSPGKIAFCTIAAIVIGVLEPLALTLQMMLPMPALSLIAVLGVALSVAGGVIPAIVLCVVAVGSTLLGFGPLVAILMAAMSLAPAAVIVLGICRKRPFFRQMFWGVTAFLACTTAAVLLAGLFFGGDMIGKAMDFVRSMFDGQKDALWASIAEVLSAGSITKADFVNAYYQTLNLMETYYEYRLLANLLSGAALSGVICVFWGNWLAARRGEATAESFRGLSEWYLPANLTLGLLMMLAASAVLNATSIPGGATVWLIVSDLAKVAFIIQGYAAMDRRLKAGGASSGRRKGMVVLAILAGVIFTTWIFDLTAIAGCGSALFGRRGAAKPWIDKIKKTMDGDDRR